jgi:hypothetical protein
MMSERRRTGRVVYDPEPDANENKEERRKKVAGELVLASLELLENNVDGNCTKTGAPFKPSLITETAFKIAPNGKYRGMKFKKTEILNILKLLVNQGKIYSVPGKSGAHKYSSFPLGGSSTTTTSKSTLVTVGSLRVPQQAIEWPQWPSNKAIDEDRISRAAKVKAENMLLLANSTEENNDDEEEIMEDGSVRLKRVGSKKKKAIMNDDSLRRRGSREIKSRFMEVDGHVILKANNYSLEEGESSVWDKEVEKIPEQPKKPLTAYMLFSKKYREEHFPPMDEEERKAKKKKISFRN